MKMTPRSLPTLKAGVALYETRDKSSLRIGTPRTWCELEREIAEPIYQALTRGASAIEISEISQISIERSQLILQELDALSLLQSSEYTISLTERFVSSIEEKAAKSQVMESDIAFQQLRARISPELETSQWVAGIKDSGASVLDQRRRAHLEIHGESSAAPLLYLMLLASGVTNTEISPWMRIHNPAIGYADTAFGVFRSGEVGLDFRKKIAELAKEFALFPQNRYENAVEVESENFEGDIEEIVIKIHFGEPDSRLLSHWMGQRIHHIFIAGLEGGTATIGPYVKPGKSPCSRCFHLSYFEQSGFGNLVKLPPARNSSERESARESVKINKIGEIPVISAHYIAAILATLILQIIDSKGSESDIEGAVLAIDLLSPANTEFIPIAMHPLCGCQWQN